MSVPGPFPPPATAKPVAPICRGATGFLFPTNPSGGHPPTPHAPPPSRDNPGHGGLPTGTVTPPSRLQSNEGQRGPTKPATPYRAREPRRTWRCRLRVEPTRTNPLRPAFPRSKGIPDNAMGISIFSPDMHFGIRLAAPDCSLEMPASGFHPRPEGAFPNQLYTTPVPPSPLRRTASFNTNSTTANIGIFQALDGLLTSAIIPTLNCRPKHPTDSASLRSETSHPFILMLAIQPHHTCNTLFFHLSNVSSTDPLPV